jgi:hypothetical protein
VLGASVRGTAHARGDLPCQDAHAWRILPGGAVVLAVADGAGSASHAEAGARAAVRAAVDAIAAHPSPENAEGWAAALDAALAAARDAVGAEAAALAVDPRDLATTLIVCVLRADGVTAAQVGDGALILSSDGGMTALTEPASGEFVNETVFLTSPGAVEGAQRTAWPGDARHVAVFTDGLQGLALKHPARTPHEPFFAPLFAFASASTDAAEAEAQLAEFLQSPRVTARADDDLTLVLAVRGDG